MASVTSPSGSIGCLPHVLFSKLKTPVSGGGAIRLFQTLPIQMTSQVFPWVLGSLLTLVTLPTHPSPPTLRLAPTPSRDPR